MRRSDRAAFDTLYERYADRLLAFAHHLTGSRADAEDLVQETFLALFSATTDFRGGSRLLTYLMAIVVRRHRDNQRRPRVAAVSLLDDTDAPDNGGNQSSSVENAVIASLDFQQALSSLDQPLRSAFFLVAAQGLTHKEAAQILGAPLGTIKWRVAEATRRLRAALSDSEIAENKEIGEPTHEPRKLLKAL